MAKIKGLFAPLTSELGNDERFLLDLTDFQKLIFILILYTSHMTHHKAPSNPQFYRSRYHLKASYNAVRNALERVQNIYRDTVKMNLEHGKETLSFINSTTYKRQLSTEVEVEVEQEVKQKKFSPKSKKTKDENYDPNSPEVVEFRNLAKKIAGKKAVV